MKGRNIFGNGICDCPCENLTYKCNVNAFAFKRKNVGSFEKNTLACSAAFTGECTAIISNAVMCSKQTEQCV